MKNQIISKAKQLQISNNPETKFYQYFNNEDIYYCGAGAFPCGSVAGTPGYMCSKQLIKKYS